MTTIRHATGHSRRRAVALAMSLESAALTTMSALHLSGALAGGTKPFDPHDAGIAEAIICVALAAGATALTRRSPGSTRTAAGAICFAIFGFFVGLYFTVQAGDAIDVAFHATMLPLLAITLTALLLTARTYAPTRSEP